jgi:hypothetical protein
MTAHFIRTFIALCCLAFIGVVGMYLANACSLKELRCTADGDRPVPIATFIDRLIDRVQ